MKKITILITCLFILLSFDVLIGGQNAVPSGGGWTGHFTITGKYFPGRNKAEFIKGTGEVNVYLPKNYYSSRKTYPLLVGLPGWRAKADEWRTKANITRFAQQYNYVIALVEVYTTAYETKYYRETNSRYKWGAIPGAIWVGEVVLPYLKHHFRIDKTGKKTGIFGLSTGGRGAVYLPQLYPKLFRACVSMSGDFDRIGILNWCKKHRRNIMRHDPPSVTIYGNPRRGSHILKRWQTVDNPSSLKNIQVLKKNKISVLLIHGKQDRAVPEEQSRNFYLKLKTAGIDVKYIAPRHFGHNWNLWTEYLPLTFQFFKNKFNNM